MTNTYTDAQIAKIINDAWENHDGDGRVILTMAQAQAISHALAERKAAVQHQGGEVDDGWEYYERGPKEGGDQRCLCTIEQDGMVYVGVAIWTALAKFNSGGVAAGKWLQNGTPIAGRVLAWRPLPEPARGRWLSGKLINASPQHVNGDGGDVRVSEEWIDRHQIAAGEWPPQSMVLLESSARRTFTKPVRSVSEADVLAACVTYDNDPSYVAMRAALEAFLKGGEGHE